MMRPVVWLAVALLMMPIALRAQSASKPASAPAFEVASVKPSPGGIPMKMLIPPRGIVTAQNVTLKLLIEKAYGVRTYQLVGGPDWLTKDRFDVTARVPEEARAGQSLEMLQSLLAERFTLRVRKETRVGPIYSLVMARDDRKLGPSLKPSPHDCTAYLTSQADPTAQDAPRDERGQTACGTGLPGGLMGSTTMVVVRGARMDDIASHLAQHADRPVIDKTNLPGTYDVGLMFTTPQGISNSRLTSDTAGGVSISLGDAVRDQLGLKLQSETGPIEFLMIESVEKPTPN